MNFHVLFSFLKGFAYSEVPICLIHEVLIVSLAYWRIHAQSFGSHLSFCSHIKAVSSLKLLILLPSKGPGLIFQVVSQVKIIVCFYFLSVRHAIPNPEAILVVVKAVTFNKCSEDQTIEICVLKSTIVYIHLNHWKLWLCSSAACSGST